MFASTPKVSAISDRLTLFETPYLHWSENKSQYGCECYDKYIVYIAYIFRKQKCKNSKWKEGTDRRHPPRGGFFFFSLSLGGGLITILIAASNTDLTFYNRLKNQAISLHLCGRIL